MLAPCPAQRPSEALVFIQPPFISGGGEWSQLGLHLPPALPPQSPVPRAFVGEARRTGSLGCGEPELSPWS